MLRELVGFEPTIRNTISDSSHATYTVIARYVWSYTPHSLNVQYTYQISHATHRWHSVLISRNFTSTHMNRLRATIGTDGLTPYASSSTLNVIFYTHTHDTRYVSDETTQ